jgi:hypothetical protein
MYSLEHRLEVSDSIRLHCAQLLAGLILLLYQDLIVATLADRDGVKLVIGTEMMNALVTSSIRIDQIHPPSVGTKVKSFHTRLEKLEYF